MSYKSTYYLLHMYCRFKFNIYVYIYIYFYFTLIILCRYRVINVCMYVYTLSHPGICKATHLQRHLISDLELLHFYYYSLRMKYEKYKKIDA